MTIATTSAQPRVRERLEAALARIGDPVGEGVRACLTVYRDAAQAAAEAADRRAAAGVSLGPLDGAIVTIKDLFDVAGEVTRAGSKVIADEGVVAKADAPVVRRLRRAGAVIVAKANMTEFAFSGVGANPHYGTPGNPADRTRIPGGSSSGGAVAVADGMCEITIGSDTGGSCRIPAALCGVVGFKPSKPRIPTEGAFPLSTTLDSIGPLARSVADCARTDSVLANEEFVPLEPAPLAGLRIGIAQGKPLDALDTTVSERFAAALDVLEKAGARLSQERLPILDDMAEVNARGGIVPPEGYAVHRARFERAIGGIDPQIAGRLARAQGILAGDYVDTLQRRNALLPVMDRRLADIDVLAMPTTPIVAPTIAEVAVDEAFGRRNAQLLRNPSIANFFNLCSISLPLPRAGGLPVGLMLMARHGHDRRLFRIAAAIERTLAA